MTDQYLPDGSEKHCFKISILCLVENERGLILLQICRSAAFRTPAFLSNKKRFVMGRIVSSHAATMLTIFCRTRGLGSSCNCQHNPKNIEKGD